MKNINIMKNAKSTKNITLTKKIKNLPQELRTLAMEIRRKTDWTFLRRENQQPPPGDWLIWLILAGKK